MPEQPYYPVVIDCGALAAHRATFHCFGCGATNNSNLTCYTAHGSYQTPPPTGW